MRYFVAAMLCAVCVFGMSLEDARADASAIPFRTDKTVSVGCGVGMMDFPQLQVLNRASHKYVDEDTVNIQQFPGASRTDSFRVVQKGDAWLYSCGVNYNVNKLASIRGIVDYNSETEDPGFKVGAALSW